MIYILLRYAIDDAISDLIKVKKKVRASLIVCAQKTIGPRIGVLARSGFHYKRWSTIVK